MQVAAHLEFRRTLRTRVSGAAAELRAGNGGEARALLQSWAFMGEERLAAAFLAQLAEADVQPSAGAWALLTEEVAGEGPDLLGWRDSAWAAVAGRTGAVEDPLAWALGELAEVGVLLDRAERGPWTRVAHVADPHLDRIAAEQWSAWAAGTPWEVRDAWEARYLRPALRAFRAVLRLKHVPPDVQQRALEDARDGFFFALLGDGAEGAGWRELAVRVLEEAGGDPVDALAAALPEGSWERVARCAVTRGHGPATATVAFGEGSRWEVQARQLERLGQTAPDALGQHLDLHLACRLLAFWDHPARTAWPRSWAVVQQNRGRARSRLRAVLREAPADHLRDRLLALPALAARTRAAVGRFAYDWAWQQLQHGLAFYDSRTIDVPCHLPAGGPPAFDADQRSALRAWVLLCIVKGRLLHLHQWVYGGTRSDLDPQDTGWGRLLSDHCPAALRSYRGASRHEGLVRLRAELADHLPAVLRDLLPPLRAVAALDPAGGKLGPAFDAAVAPAWHDSVGLPKVRYKQYIGDVRLALPLVEGMVSDDPPEEEEAP